MDEIRADAFDNLPPGKVQDAYSLRCMPQVHGPARDAAAYVEDVLLDRAKQRQRQPARSSAR